jgi:transcription elongation factor Elf1
LKKLKKQRKSKGDNKMGKKYKKKLPIKPPKKIPTVFQCPNCGKKSVNVEIDENRGEATITCGNCGINVKIEIPSIFTAVDAYGRFIDLYYSGGIKVGEGKEHEHKNW